MHKSTANIIFDTLYASLVTIFRVVRATVKQEYYTICPPSAYGSVGDDAMTRVLVKNAFEENRKVLILGGQEADSWKIIKVDKILSINRSMRLSNILALSSMFAVTKKLFLVGADIMDGFYDPSSVLGRIRLARFAEKIGIQVVVTGFSFSDNPNDQICSELQRLSSTKFYLRDGFSLSRFSRITGIKGVLSADLAFLTQSALLDKRFDAIQNWKIQQKHIDQIIVIVNANWIPFKSTFTRVEELVDAYVGIIKKLDDLYEKKISVMLFPNDYRDAENTGDINLSRLIHAGLSHVMEARVISIHDYTYNAEEARALTENCDFLVSGRMHLAIICATNGIPSMAIEYQSKFKGMYKHLGLDPESLLVSPGTFLAPGMAGEIKSIMDRKDDLRKQILARLPHVKQLAHRNFDF